MVRFSRSCQLKRELPFPSACSKLLVDRSCAVGIISGLFLENSAQKPLDMSVKSCFLTLLIFLRFRELPSSCISECWVSSNLGGTAIVECPASLSNHCISSADPILKLCLDVSLPSSRARIGATCPRVVSAVVADICVSCRPSAYCSTRVHQLSPSPSSGPGLRTRRLTYAEKPSLVVVTSVTKINVSGKKESLYLDLLQPWSRAIFAGTS